MATPTLIVGTLAAFVAVAMGFVFVNLLVGRLLRPKAPTAEKLEIYECGEPTIGSSFVQFDLRFYVVALLFIIFDVEVAFFFPWATVFGKANQIVAADAAPPAMAVAADAEIEARLRELVGYRSPLARLDSVEPGPMSLRQGSDARRGAAADAAGVMARASLVDMLVFFAVLMVGFAYVWKRGDLDWVRAAATRSDRPPPAEQPGPATRAESLVGV
ncbi:NAD(P)H-quinone oxidoreductase subunit 3 [Pirellulimonas nuda]|uniref:NADH-quinone oxidoreductase subunit n=1 Tax=Pirellulimonas nuda TaxID=2528009 RepID=A0A518DEV2_9BACT|nr:NADH-quinone oxidoreductase subunit A [Pirellulimonas nuda]QDU89962.1 NAD(P)H-quinone oxidoreductase subunit 3 [Pirellulimonas nuda]